jgi:hypothetical protein
MSFVPKSVNDIWAGLRVIKIKTQATELVQWVDHKTETE